MAHSHHLHREHHVAHRRVHKILEEAHPHAHKHSKSHAFSKVTSKTAAVHHDAHVSGKKSVKRYKSGGRITGKPSDMKHIAHELQEHERKEHHYARGGKVKDKGHQINIAIMTPKSGGNPPPAAAGPMAGPPPGGPPMMPPPGGAPGGGPPMPMPRARGGRTGHIDGEATKADIKKWGARAAKHSYARGGATMTAGAMSGVGRLEQAAHQKKKK